MISTHVRGSLTTPNSTYFLSLLPLSWEMCCHHQKERENVDPYACIYNQEDIQGDKSYR